MSKSELEVVGREVLILRTMAQISTLEAEIEEYQARYGSFEALEAKHRSPEAEDYALDCVYDDWNWARQTLNEAYEQLRALQADAAA